MIAFEFRSYCRPFRRSVQTSHGLWTCRQGIVLRLVNDQKQVGFGEVAPVAWFGSESFEQAMEFCHQLPTQISFGTIATIPDHLPACQFGFESAWESMTANQAMLQEHESLENSVCQFSTDSIAVNQTKLTHSALLPAGEAALQTWKPLWEQGYCTFKWKIGVAPIQNELQTLEQLLQALPPNALLRLDANGGLSEPDAKQWLQICDRAPTIEFLEQPLSVDQFDTMLRLSQNYSTLLALDESVANLNQLQACYRKGWRGIFVIKPAIVGFPSHLRQFCQQYSIDAVFSSVFETAIGRQAGLKLAAELSNKSRAVGYGTTHWFDDLTLEEGEKLWQTL